MNAVIDEKSFNKLAKYIDEAKQDKSVEIIAGEITTNLKVTLLSLQFVVKDPKYVTMCEELFGPVLITMFTR
ncbi:hypothetical protein [Pedobacter steynii]